MIPSFARALTVCTKVTRHEVAAPRAVGPSDRTYLLSYFAWASSFRRSVSL
jgi:hypothetical protein